MDWADKLAQEIVDTPGILQVWDKSGYCRKCKMPIKGAMIDLTLLKRTLADQFRGLKEDCES